MQRGHLNEGDHRFYNVDWSGNRWFHSECYPPVNTVGPAPPLFEYQDCMPPSSQHNDFLSSQGNFIDQGGNFGMAQQFRNFQMDQRGDFCNDFQMPRRDNFHEENFSAGQQDFHYSGNFPRGQRKEYFDPANQRFNGHQWHAEGSVQRNNGFYNENFTNNGNFTGMTIYGYQDCGRGNILDRGNFSPSNQCHSPSPTIRNEAQGYPASPPFVCNERGARGSRKTRGYARAPRAQQGQRESRPAATSREIFLRRSEVGGCRTRSHRFSEEREAQKGGSCTTRTLECKQDRRRQHQPSTSFSTATPSSSRTAKSDAASSRLSKKRTPEVPATEGDSDCEILEPVPPKPRIHEYNHSSSAGTQIRAQECTIVEPPLRPKPNMYKPIHRSLVAPREDLGLYKRRNEIDACDMFRRRTDVDKEMPSRSNVGEFEMLTFLNRSALVNPSPPPQNVSWRPGSSSRAPPQQPTTAWKRPEHFKSRYVHQIPQLYKKPAKPSTTVVGESDNNISLVPVVKGPFGHSASKLTTETFDVVPPLISPGLTNHLPSAELQDKTSPDHVMKTAENKTNDKRKCINGGESKPSKKCRLEHREGHMSPSKPTETKNVRDIEKSPKQHKEKAEKSPKQLKDKAEKQCSVPSLKQSEQVASQGHLRLQSNPTKKSPKRNMLEERVIENQSEWKKVWSTQSLFPKPAKKVISQEYLKQPINEMHEFDFLATPDSPVLPKKRYKVSAEKKQDLPEKTELASEPCKSKLTLNLKSKETSKKKSKMNLRSSSEVDISKDDPSISECKEKEAKNPMSPASDKKQVISGKGNKLKEKRKKRHKQIEKSHSTEQELVAEREESSKDKDCSRIEDKSESMEKKHAKQHKKSQNIDREVVAEREESCSKDKDCSKEKKHQKRKKSQTNEQELVVDKEGSCSKDKDCSKKKDKRESKERKHRKKHKKSPSTAQEELVSEKKIKSSKDKDCSKKEDNPKKKVVPSGDDKNQEESIDLDLLLTPDEVIFNEKGSRKSSPHEKDPNQIDLVLEDIFEKLEGFEGPRQEEVSSVVAEPCEETAESQRRGYSPDSTTKQVDSPKTQQIDSPRHTAEEEFDLQALNNKHDLSVKYLVADATNNKNPMELAIKEEREDDIEFLGYFSQKAAVAKTASVVTSAETMDVDTEDESSTDPESMQAQTSVHSQAATEEQVVDPKNTPPSSIEIVELVSDNSNSTNCDAVGVVKNPVDSEFVFEIISEVSSDSVTEIKSEQNNPEETQEKSTCQDNKEFASLLDHIVEEDIGQSASSAEMTNVSSELVQNPSEFSDISLSVSSSASTLEDLSVQHKHNIPKETMSDVPVLLECPVKIEELQVAATFESPIEEVTDNNTDSSPICSKPNLQESTDTDVTTADQQETELSVHPECNEPELNQETKVAPQEISVQLESETCTSQANQEEADHSALNIIEEEPPSSSQQHILLNLSLNESCPPQIQQDLVQVPVKKTVLLSIPSNDQQIPSVDNPEQFVELKGWLFSYSHAQEFLLNATCDSLKEQWTEMCISSGAKICSILYQWMEFPVQFSFLLIEFYKYAASMKEKPTKMPFMNVLLQLEEIATRIQKESLLANEQDIEMIRCISQKLAACKLEEESRLRAVIIQRNAMATSVAPPTAAPQLPIDQQLFRLLMQAQLQAAAMYSGQTGTVSALPGNLTSGPQAQIQPSQVVSSANHNIDLARIQEAQTAQAARRNARSAKPQPQKRSCAKKKTSEPLQITPQHQQLIDFQQRNMVQPTLSHTYQQQARQFQQWNNGTYTQPNYMGQSQPVQHTNTTHSQPYSHVYPHLQQPTAHMYNSGATQFPTCHKPQQQTTRYPDLPKLHPAPNLQAVNGNSNLQSMQQQMQRMAMSQPQRYYVPQQAPSTTPRDNIVPPVYPASVLNQLQQYRLPSLTPADGIQTQTPRVSETQTMSRRPEEIKACAVREAMGRQQVPTTQAPNSDQLRAAAYYWKQRQEAARRQEEEMKRQAVRRSSVEVEGHVAAAQIEPQNLVNMMWRQKQLEYEQGAQQNKTVNAAAQQGTQSTAQNLAESGLEQHAAVHIPEQDPQRLVNTTSDTVVPNETVEFNIQPCAVCGKMAEDQCQQCEAVWYCGVKCQADDWNKEHRSACELLAAAASKNVAAEKSSNVPP